MPFINLNGQLTEVSQEAYDIWTVGQNQNQVGTVQSPAEAANAVAAAGGNVTTTPTATETILTPNTTDNTPGQTLSVTNETVSTNAPAEDPQAAARVGLTEQQLVALGGADATDPYIRANLGLPPLTEIQTLAGAVGNISTGSLGNIIGNLTSSFGNAVSDIGNLFTSSANAAPSASEIDQAPADVVPGTATANPAYNEEGQLNAGWQLNETNDPVYVGDNANTPILSDGDTTLANDSDSYYQQFQTAFKEALDQPEPTESPYAPVATTDETPLVLNDNTAVEGTVVVEAAPAEFNTAEPIVIPDAPDTDQPIDTNAGQDSLSADQLNDIATAQGVAGEEGFITTDTYSGQESLSPDELDAIANAQGVAGEEGNITADTLARDPGSYSAAELDAIAAAQGVDAGEVANDGTTEQQLFDNEAAVSAQAAKDRAQKQATLKQQQGLDSANDWRVKLSLAKNADYLYNAKNADILKPLRKDGGTDGVVFPYTPQITTNYRADYSAYTLTHSNYKGYFYNNSYVDAINITAMFTAQDTLEAQYLLAVIHFFRTVTKMFYGQDTQRGSPPPLVFLSGLGEYQFNRHPCLVSQFNYTLPADVDYIRASSIVNQGISFNNVRSNQSAPVSGLAGVSRLANALLPKGAKAQPPAYQSLSKGNPTYVPTKMEITITLLPVQSRNQVSKIFKLSEYANGNQLKGGFW